MLYYYRQHAEQRQSVLAIWWTLAASVEIDTENVRRLTNECRTEL
jgi:hypothetical protein